MEEPRIRFCWACMEKLWGNHHEIMEIEGHKRILHKGCAKIIKKGGEVVSRFHFDEGGRDGTF